MMKYLKKEISVLQITKNDNKFSEKEKNALALVLDQYNKLFTTAVYQQNYIKEKQPEYAREMEQNFKLLERNKYLEDSIKKYKELYKNQLKYIKTIEKDLQTKNRLLGTKLNVKY